VLRRYAELCKVSSKPSHIQNHLKEKIFSGLENGEKLNKFPLAEKIELSLAEWSFEDIAEVHRAANAFTDPPIYQRK